MTKPKNVLQQTRCGSVLRQSDMGKRIGYSVPTIIRFEANPEHMRLDQLCKWYNAIDAKERPALRKYIMNFFA